MHPALRHLAPALAKTFQDAGFTAAGIEDCLGSHGIAALYRGEPSAARYYARGNSRIELLIRTILLRDAADHTTVIELLGEATTQGLIDAGALRFEDSNVLRFQIDIRPHVLLGEHHWIFSDADAAMTEHIPAPEHVLGVGAASLSLVHATPTTPVNTLLDLGCGSGVQALAQSRTARKITATDIHPRALEFAAASLAASNVDAELLAGPWFEPVQGRRFDRIVANPPFVVGLPEIGHIYRDSGLDLDGASELVISQAPQHLHIGGCAILLAAWVHQDGTPWQHRVASWLPDTGVAAWVLQRDVADPAHYVGTWLKDESLDPRSITSAARTEAWLEHFDKAGVTGIGFGFVAIQRLADNIESDIVCEEMPQQFTDPLGTEIAEYFERIAWLRTTSAAEITDTQFFVRPGVAVENITVADTELGMGFAPAALRITRTDGPRWSHDVDTHLHSITAGLNPHGLPLGEVVELYCAAKQLDADAMMPTVIAAIVDLVRHGVVLPTVLMEN